MAIIGSIGKGQGNSLPNNIGSIIKAQGNSLPNNIGSIISGAALVSQVDFFLKIDGIPGESLDAAHKGEIEVDSWTFAATQGASITGSGLGAGQAEHGPFHFLMKFNKASPKLFLACVQGDHIKSAVLTCRKAGTTQQPYLQIVFTDFMITEYAAVGGAGHVLPSDQVALVYSKVEVIYHPQDFNGALLGATRMGIDVKGRKPF